MASVTTGDEVGELRAALLRGEWRRLAGAQPGMLDLLAFGQPDAWPRLVQACAAHVAMTAVEWAEDRWAADELRHWLETVHGPLTREQLRGLVPEGRLPAIAFALRIPQLLGEIDEPRRPAAALQLARRVVGRYRATRGGGDALVAALAVLERWPVG